MQEVCQFQLKDEKLSATIDYLEKKELPGEEKVAKKLVLESQIYEMV